jgi:hypothetical protein
MNIQQEKRTPDRIENAYLQMIAEREAQKRENHWQCAARAG